MDDIKPGDVFVNFDDNYSLRRVEIIAEVYAEIFVFSRGDTKEEALANYKIGYLKYLPTDRFFSVPKLKIGRYENRRWWLFTWHAFVKAAG